jgi:hypothetical protein
MCCIHATLKHNAQNVHIILGTSIGESSGFVGVVKTPIAIRLEDKSLIGTHKA